MRGSNKGFTFIELILIIFLLGLLISLIIPNFKVMRPRYERELFISQLTSLINIGWQNALIRQQVHRVFFDLKKRQARLEIKTGDSKTQKEQFEVVEIPYVLTQYTWPDQFEIKGFFIESKDLINRVGIKTDTVWFYQFPDGFVQPVVINILDRLSADNVSQIGLTVNPFTGRVKANEQFAKSE